MSRKKDDEPKARKTHAPFKDRPNLPIQFDPRWAQATTCKAGCGPATPCDGPVHGGYKIGLLAKAGPQADWPQKLQTALCFLCRCTAGANVCEAGCACHG